MMRPESAPNTRRASRPWGLVRPVLAEVANRSNQTRNRPGFGPPEAWFDASALAAADLYAVSFDFFINWSTHELERPFWLKRSAVPDPDGVPNFDLAAVKSALAEDPENFPEGARLHAFAVANGYEPAWAIIPDWFAWDEGKGGILLCDIGATGEPTRVDVVRLADLMNLIYRHTGQYFRPWKGLYWSFTSLEAALAKTRTPWPGDADVVLVSAETHEARAVIELKKHTQQDPLSSSFAAYYPGKDTRRWDRLALLAQSLPGQPPLFGFFYSVHSKEPNAIIHEIVGAPSDLAAGPETRFPVPTSTRTAAPFTTNVLTHYGIHG